MYIPGLDGSPYSTAVELPEGLVLHLMLSGRLYLHDLGIGFRGVHQAEKAE